MWRNRLQIGSKLGAESATPVIAMCMMAVKILTVAGAMLRVSSTRPVNWQQL